MAQLLVSVRNVKEAQAALAGGADWIDVKEPARGSLGRADDADVAAVRRFVNGRRPISAALGELVHHARLPRDELPDLLKVGLAGAAALRWADELRLLRHALDRRGGSLIPATYADWRWAGAPPPLDVLRFASHASFPGLLIDTCRKDGLTLLDRCDRDELLCLCRQAHQGGLFLALAGSLKEADIAHVLPLGPDIIAVRGAACRDGCRDAQIDPERVQRLASIVHATEGISSRRLTTRTTEREPASRGNHSSTMPAAASSSSVAPVGMPQALSKISLSAPAS